jgi:hypothetical protein
MGEPEERAIEPISIEGMIFDANLAEFGNRVQIICSLEAGGHLSAEDAFARVKSLWKQLKRSKKNLQIGEQGAH